MSYFIHEKALVETKQIGEGSRIWAFVHILPNAVIGRNANICDMCFVENDVTLGDNVTVKCHVALWDGITIEDNVFIGPSASFTNDNLPRSKNTSYKQLKTLLKRGCSIGANATILPGIRIGSYAMVGAGSVVTKNVEDYSLVYGNPAVIKGYVCECGEKLIFQEDNALCACGKAYTKKDSKVLKVS